MEYCSGRCLYGCEDCGSPVVDRDDDEARDEQSLLESVDADAASGAPESAVFPAGPRGAK